MEKDNMKEIHIIGGGLAGADDAGRKLLRNKDCNDGNNKNVARTAQYIRAETVPRCAPRD
jgi:hypothetical protein